MAVDLCKHDDRRLMEVRVTGRLTDRDYEVFAPELDRFVREHGKIRMIFDMHGFRGWKPAAMWRELKLGRRHGHNLERLALVGEKRWQRWSSKLCRLLTDAEVRYFDRSRADEAQEWVTRN